MMKKYRSIPIHIAAAAVLVLFFYLGAVIIWNFWVYIEGFLRENALFAGDYERLRDGILLAGAGFMIPCVFILFLAQRLAWAVGCDRIFTKQTASLLSLIAGLLCGDCVLFSVGILVLRFWIGETLMSGVFAMIALIGFALSYFLYLLSGYVCRAAEMKEEVDATL